MMGWYCAPGSLCALFRAGAWQALLALWLTLSLPFALTNILYDLRRDSARRAQEMIFDPRYWQGLPLATGFAALMFGLSPLVLFRRGTSWLIAAVPALSNPWLVALMLTVGLLLFYGLLYELPERRKLRKLLTQRYAFGQSAELTGQELLERHVLLVDADGLALEAQPSYSWRYFLGLVPLFKRLDEAMLNDHLSQMIAAIEQSNTTELVVFFHGGLNDFRPNLLRTIARASLMLSDRKYPLFILWRSGLLPCYGWHLWHVREGRPLFRFALRFVLAPAKLIADIGRGLTRILTTWYYQVMTDMKPLFPWFNPDETTWKVLAERLEHYQHEAPASALRLELKQDTRCMRPWCQLLRVCAYLNAWTLSLSYLVWLPIDAFGKAAWDVMVRRTYTMFKVVNELDLYAETVPSPSFNLSKPGEVLTTLRAVIQNLSRTTTRSAAMPIITRDAARPSTTPSTAQAVTPQPRVHKLPDDLSAFTLAKAADAHTMPTTPDAIDQLLRSHPSGAAYRLAERLTEATLSAKTLTLIGHSMGAIVLNRWLEHFPQLSYKALVYMAAACSIRDCASTVIPCLRENPHTQFYNLMLHPRAEQSEFHLADFTPRGSLLEWIDSYFSLPMTFDDRTAGKWENFLQATHLFDDVRNRVHLKGFGYGPRDRDEKNHPTKHGEFTDCAFWQETFWTVR